jgi:hypothetical protein
MSGDNGNGKEPGQEMPVDEFEIPQDTPVAVEEMPSPAASPDFSAPAAESVAVAYAPKPVSLNDASRMASVDTGKQHRNLMGRLESLKKVKEEKITGNAPKGVDKVIEEKYQAIDNSIKDILAGEMKSAKDTKVKEIETEEKKINSGLIRRAFNPVAKVFGYSTMVKLPKEINENEVLEGVINTYLTEAESSLQTKRTQLEQQQKLKKVLGENASGVKTYIMECVDVYDEAKADEQALIAELNALRTDKKNLLSQKKTQTYDSELDRNYNKVKDIIAEKEKQLEETSIIKTELERDVAKADVDVTFDAVSLGIGDQAVRDLEENISRTEMAYKMLSTFKEKRIEKDAILNIYKGIAGSIVSNKKVEAVNAAIQDKFAALLDTVKKTADAPRTYITPSLESALDRAKEAANQIGCETIEKYRRIRDTL